MAKVSVKAKTRKCNKCGKVVAEKDGVEMLRGVTFACKSCYKKYKEETKNAEVCEFC